MLNYLKRNPELARDKIEKKRESIKIGKFKVFYYIGCLEIIAKYGQVERTKLKSSLPFCKFPQ